jgi:hypothetical protein
MDGLTAHKKIEKLAISDVIKAFLVNLNPLKQDFNNSDLMELFDPANSKQKICFALSGNYRTLLDISDLCQFNH